MTADELAACDLDTGGTPADGVPWCPVCGLDLRADGRCPGCQPDRPRAASKAPAAVAVDTGRTVVRFRDTVPGVIIHGFCVGMLVAWALALSLTITIIGIVVGGVVTGGYRAGHWIGRRR